MKKISFLGDSLKHIRDFPDDARSEAGYNLYIVQQGFSPADFRPMPTIGHGTYEIRIREEDGIFRVFYVADRPEAVYVLHAFQKKSRTTSKKDIELGRQRYQEIPGGGKR